MIAIDTHVHLLISKAAAPDWDEITFATQAAHADGLKALCITEHLDARYYPELMEGLFHQLRLGGHLLSPGVLQLENGLCLSCGAEISLHGGGDVGVHAEPGVLLALERGKGAYSLAGLTQHLRQQTGPVTIVAHHVYWPGKAIADLASQASTIDALELPAKDLQHATLYRALAATLHLPLLGGSDAHTWIQIGSARSLAPLPPDEPFSPARLRCLLQAGAIHASALACAGERVRLSGLLRAQLERAPASHPAARS